MSDLQKHTLHLFAGDFERLKEVYQDLGASIVIRTLVRKHLEKLAGGEKEIKIEVTL